MFNFRRKFSNSPKTSRFERALVRFFVAPELDLATRANLKKRLLNRIIAECEEVRSAEILDKKLSSKKVGSGGLLDVLAAIAEALLNLPKVLPGRKWRVETRQNFESPRHFRFFGLLRQATAFALLLVVVGGISLTTFVSKVPTAAAQLSVSSGIVKIRFADSPFFEDVREVATVRLGDTIRVEKDSTAELAFYDASKMTLTESTEVEITEFKPDFISRGNSSVKVALLSGSLDAEVAKADSSFSVETPTGSVEATNAKFSVAVNSTTGSTKIATSEDVVAVKSSKNNSESVALVAGESVVFADGPEVAVAEITELPSLEKVQTDLELAKIWSFDALVAAQKDDKTVAQKTLTGAREKLTALLVAGGVEPVEGDEVEALEIFLRKNYPEVAGREIALTNLHQFAEVGEILNYYFVAPQKLRGVPELELLVRDEYSPGRLRNLFVVLRAREIAHPEIAPLVENLSTELVGEIAAKFDDKNASARFAELLADMQHQPIFIPFLQKLAPLVPVTLGETIAAEIATMEARVSEYVGA